MLYGIKLVVKHLLGKDIAGRNFRLLPDDVFLASYPRSGNTWTRFLLANLVHPDIPVSFANIERLFPDAMSLSSRAMKRVRPPRLIKTHEYFEPRYRKVIYLVRDPRDVAVSLYDFRRKYRSVSDGYPIEQYVAERFLPGDLDVSWAEHVGSWLGTRMHHPGFLLVRYEDLLEDTPGVLGRIAGFLGIEADAARLTRAVAKSSANRLRTLLDAEHEQWVTTRGKRADVPFVARASAGGWRQTLPATSVALIESAWGHLMDTLGYQTSTPPAARPRALTL